MGWMHAGPVNEFHCERRKVVEAIIILDCRMLTWVVSLFSMTFETMILERFLVVTRVVMFVIHLQLAHVAWQETYGGGVCIRVWEGVIVLDKAQEERQLGIYPHTAGYFKK
ncbi:hypothetical protein IG631_24082 [Alternaria alternata]|nr:hypothetical protein IG631_24082 [Alternaria alternata]